MSGADTCYAKVFALCGAAEKPAIGGYEKGIKYFTKKAIDFMEILPESEQNFALEFIKKLVLAWDPDFTKVTPAEAKAMEAAEQSGYVDEADIDWNNIGIDEE